MSGCEPEVGPGPDAIMLLGPTACGKSHLAMHLALNLAPHLNAEIVAVDSAQVYRGMDIGTAKPSADERRRVPHHLLDLRDPADPYSAADFERDASRTIATLRARGRLPLLVGGSMLYAKALRDGLAQLPAADPQLRRELEAEAAAHGWAALHARLARVDPLSASRLAPLDSQRIQRALEVHALSGEPLSALLARSAQVPRRLRIIALLPADRAELHRRIEARFDAMLGAGFLDEVRALIARGDLHAQLPSQRSVGYRQAWEHLRNATLTAQFRDAALAATRRLAKHQMTWLRSMHADLVLDPFAPDVALRTAEALEQMVAGFCGQP